MLVAERNLRVFFFFVWSKELKIVWEKNQWEMGIIFKKVIQFYLPSRYFYSLYTCSVKKNNTFSL